MSNWKAITLGSAFNGVSNSNRLEQDALNKKVQEISALITQLNNEILDAQSALGVTNQTLQSLLTSGFYILDLPPAEGGIITRIENAANQPQSIGQNYSAGIVIATQMTSIQQVLNNYEALKRVVDFNNQANL